MLPACHSAISGVGSGLFGSLSYYLLLISFPIWHSFSYMDQIVTPFLRSIHGTAVDLFVLTLEMHPH